VEKQHIILLRIFPL